MTAEAFEPAAAGSDAENLVHAVSHELRSPLGALLVFSGLLARDCDGQLDEHGRDLLRRVNDCARRTVALLDRLMLYVRLLRQPLVHQTRDVLAEARAAFTELSRARSGAVPVLDSGTLPEAVADPVLMRLLLAELLDNAVKFTAARPDARIELGGESDADETRWFVRDNGIGFDPELSARLFTPFGRLHAQAEHPGAGLGLAIVRRIAERHGGRTWATASPGGGATFHVALPRRPSQVDLAGSPAA